MCLPIRPYKVESEFEHAGLKCAVVMNREAMNRCGYVRVPPSHPYHGWKYERPDVEVHGGLTFAEIEPCIEEDGTGWWFGFDCAHADDAMFDPDVKMEDLKTEEARAVIKVHREFRSPFTALYERHVCARIGEEVHDDTAQLHVHQYLGGPEPTSGSLET